MSFKNFFPTVWSEAISRDLERLCVFAENTNRQYEGEVKNLGDSVRILGVGKPTIYTANNKNIVLDKPEQIEDSSVTMNINQIAYFDYMVEDIDKIQSKNGEGISFALSQEISEGIANVMDKYIANLAKDKMAVVNTAVPTVVTAENILSVIDDALIKLYSNDVKQNTRITLTCSPKFYMLLRQAYTKLDSNNSDIMKNGNVGRYGNVEVKMSNNVAEDINGTELIQLKTDRAIAFCNPNPHTEAYRPENYFSDAVKGFALFDAKIVRPKEMIVLNVKFA